VFCLNGAPVALPYEEVEVREAVFEEDEAYY
jgi:hypothetical protein